MKPAKGLVNLSNWLLRGSVLLFVSWGRLSTLEVINFKNTEDIISLTWIGFSALLFVGGFVKKPGLTIISAGGLTLVSLYLVFTRFHWPLDTAYLALLWPLATGVHFIARGNQ